MDTTRAQLAIPRAQSPGDAGISSQVLARMMRDILDKAYELHSIMVLRQGQVAYEQFRKPYGPNEPHTMYSTSKSITALAVGYAVTEGKISLDDKVTDYVPELLECPHENWEKLKIFHLITMTAGKNINYLADKRKKKWIWDYSRSAWDFAPGEGFHYCNENCYMLCVILQRVYGESVVDILMPRLFEPLGIPKPFWETDGCGVETGGWGLYLSTESLAKIGLCIINDGKYQGEQVIPAEWVREASRAQSDTVGEKEEHDNYGYGYGLRMNQPPGGFRTDGLFAQFMFMFPEYDAVIVTTGGEGDKASLLYTIFDHLPALFTEEDSAPCEIPLLPEYPPLAAAPRNSALEAYIEGRSIHFPEATKFVNNKIGFPLSIIPGMIFFMSADKAGGVDNVVFRFGEDSVKFSWSEGPERNTVLCGLDGRARKCKITLGGVEFIMICSAAWEDDKLRLRLRCLTSVSERRLTFRFKGRGVGLLFRSSPGLECLKKDCMEFARENIPGDVSEEFISKAVDTALLMAEPPIAGYLR